MVFGKNKSLACFKPNPNAALRLVCFPCAGGGASMYRVWAELLPDVEVWAVNYPGRESLHGQPFASNTDELAAGVVEHHCDALSTAENIDVSHAEVVDDGGSLDGFHIHCRGCVTGCAAHFYLSRLLLDTENEINKFYLC